MCSTPSSVQLQAMQTKPAYVTRDEMYSFIARL